MINKETNELSDLAFSRYLTECDENVFLLDLSNASLLDCIYKMCEIKKRLHPKIWSNYNLLIGKITALQEKYGCTVYPYMISSVFWNYFIPYLSGIGLKYSTITTLKANLISTLNWSSKYGAKLNPSYNEAYVPNYQPMKISLTPDEISHIYHFKIGMTKSYSLRSKKLIKYKKNKIRTLELVRDTFCLACNLGQRYSDITRIGPENFKNGYFSITQQKTGNKCTLDIDTMCIDKRMTWSILEKYGYKSPYTGDINNFNTYLHELLMHIGDSFNDDVRYECKINGEIVSETKKRYQLISSHTARRSFATINTLRNVQRSKILRATGHSSEKAFVRYICYNDEI